jgi:hypothetical protein
LRYAQNEPIQLTGDRKLPKFQFVPRREFAKHIAGLPLALAWGVVVLSGMVAMVRYEMTPGAPGSGSPRDWPRTVSDLPLNADGFTLVMLVHPQCTCSRASMHELTELMSRSDGKIAAHVLFVKPAGAPANWCDSDLWKQAKDVPGVSVAVDENGQDATAFQATTSGQVVAYDGSGRIRFSGGITDGRGHEGDNPGLSAILSLVRTGQTSLTSNPVFGCSLGVYRLESLDTNK